MSEEQDHEIALTYRRHGGTGRIKDDGEIAREEELDPPEAKQYWESTIAPRIAAGTHSGVFNFLK